MPDANHDQIAQWNADSGRTWTGEQERLDRLIAAYGAAALAKAAARPGERVLDVGCGCGETSLALARAVGASGAVLGVDVSEPMLGRARERGVGVAQLRFELGDASRAPLGGPHDLLFSRFGVMFFDAPVAAFAHMRAAMAPDGRLAFVCWRSVTENAWALLPAGIGRRLIGAPQQAPDPDAPGPFAFADADRVRAILEEAGWSDVRIEAFDAPMPLGADARDAALCTGKVGPLAAMLRDAEDKREAVMDALTEALKTYETPAGVNLPGAVWIVSATA